MDQNPASGAGPAAWWRHALAQSQFLRRRALALGLGLGGLSLLTWLGSGVLTSSPAASPRAGTAGHGLPLTAAGSRPAERGSADRGRVTPAPHARTVLIGPHSPLSGTGDLLGTGVASSASLGGAAQTCPARDLSLSLFTPHPRYRFGQQPEFAVTMVSTATGACTVNLGPRFVAVEVSDGRSTIWNSARCAAWPGSVTVTLARGRPALVWVTWNRQTSAAACHPGDQHAPRGSYTATAAGDGLRSPLVQFALGRAR